MGSADIIELSTCVMESMLGTDAAPGCNEVASMCRAFPEEAAIALEGFEKAGWLQGAGEADGASLYGVGSPILPFADRGRLHHELVRQSSSLIQELSARTGQTAILSALHDFCGVCLFRAESSQPIRLISEIGRELPLHAGATGKVLLAFAPQALRERLLSGTLRRFTPYTVTDPEVLRRQLSEICEEGYAFTREEVDPGACALGVPLRSLSGRLLAVLSVAGPWFEFADREEQLLREMRWSLARIEVRLGLSRVER